MLLPFEVTLTVFMVLSGCAHTASIEPPGPGHPAFADSGSVEFTPPPNPFAMPLEPVQGDAGAAGHEMGDMPGMKHDAGQPQHGAVEYVCPMHPDVRSSEPGKCPKCGMKLVPDKDGDQHEKGGAR